MPISIKEKAARYAPTRSTSPKTGRITYVPTTPPKTPGEVSGSLIHIDFAVHAEHASALRSVIDEISQELGERVVGPHSYAREASLTNALVVLGTLRAAVNAKIARGDENYAR